MRSVDRGVPNHIKSSYHYNVTLSKGGNNIKMFQKLGVLTCVGSINDHKIQDVPMYGALYHQHTLLFILAHVLSKERDIAAHKNATP